MRAFLRAWDALPLGTFDADFEGRRYSVTRTEKSGGRQGWIWAEELGGTQRISANLYRLRKGTQLKPCEMPTQTVINFVLNAKPLNV